MSQGKKLSKNEQAVLKLLSKEKMTPLDIATIFGLDMTRTQSVIASLLEKGLITKTSDGFTSFLTLSKLGQDTLNSGM